MEVDCGWNTKVKSKLNAISQIKSGLQNKTERVRLIKGMPKTLQMKPSLKVRNQKSYEQNKTCSLEKTNKDTFLRRRFYFAY